MGPGVKLKFWAWWSHVGIHGPSLLTYRVSSNVSAWAQPSTGAPVCPDADLLSHSPRVPCTSHREPLGVRCCSLRVCMLLSACAALPLFSSPGPPSGTVLNEHAPTPALRCMHTHKTHFANSKDRAWATHQAPVCWMVCSTCGEMTFKVTLF